jgi:hypothetical protein
MYRWRIQISSNDSQLLSYLLATLENSPHKLLVEDGYYYLVSSSFESYQFPAEVQELYACADKVIARLNGLLKLQSQVQSGIFKTTPVVYVDDAGLQHLIILETIQIKDEIRGYVGDNFFQHAARPQPDLVTKWLVEGNNPLVDEVLNNLIEDQVNWNSLYNIYKLIESDAEGRAFKDWTKGWGSRFTHTANNFKANPLARHSSVESPGELPAKFQALALSEAAEHIAILINQWLQNKH